MEPPESICSGSSTRIINNPGFKSRTGDGAHKIPIEVVANRLQRHAQHKQWDRSANPGTPSTPFTISIKTRRKPPARPAPSTTLYCHRRSPKEGVTGITNRCSTVPCSRSRISADPVSTIASMVMLFDNRHPHSTPGQIRVKAHPNLQRHRLNVISPRARHKAVDLAANNILEPQHSICR